MIEVLRPVTHLADAAKSMLLSLLHRSGRIGSEERPLVPRAMAVDLARYAGPWFIIGAIPLPLVESGAHNPVETYRLAADGRIDVIFQLRKNAFNGRLKSYRTHAVVDASSHNAVWKVRTVWPLMQQYVISHLEADYSAAIVARDSRDYVWILSRTPTLDDARMAAYKARITSMGYDLQKFHFYPQSGAMPGG